MTPGCRKLALLAWVALGALPVYAEAAPITLLHITGDPGDVVSMGQDSTFTPGMGVFAAGRMFDRTAHMTFTSPTHYWTIDMAAPYLGRLLTGRHDNLSLYPSQAITEWGVGVSGEGRGCASARSSLDIQQVRTDSTGHITLLQATVEQHCNAGLAALRAQIVFNADTMLYVVSPQDVYAFAAEPVAFGVQATDAKGEAMTLSASGLPPGATFVDQGGGSGQFAWPGGSAAPGTFVITVTAHDVSGRTASATTWVRVHGPDFIRLDSDPDHFITLGMSQFYTDANAALNQWSNSLEAASAGAVTPEDDYALAFAAPYPRPLNAGHHVAQNAPAGEYPSALSIEANYHGCNVATGWFDVRQVVFDADGNLTNLWVVFEHHCEGTAPAVRGEIRMHADTSVYVLPPADAYVMAGTDTTLTITATDTHGHPLVITAADVPPGCSFTDHGNGTAELRVGRGLTTPGEYPIVFSCANGFGNLASATSFLHVEQGPLAVPYPGPGVNLGLQGAGPNPASGAVWVTFSLPDGSPAQLELVDLAGRSIRVLEIGSLGAGSHRVSLVDARPVRPGCYWIRLRRGDQMLTRSAIVLR